MSFTHLSKARVVIFQGEGELNKRTADHLCRRGWCKVANKGGVQRRQPIDTFSSILSVTKQLVGWMDGPPMAFVQRKMSQVAFAEETGMKSRK